MTMMLVFVRHAQGTHNISYVNDPANFDAELTDIGHQQTKENIIIGSGVFDAIYCSPLRRCRSTLLGIYPESETMPVILDDRLMELPCGLNICDKRLEKSDMILPKNWDNSNISEINPWIVDSNEDTEKIKSFTNDLVNKHKCHTVLIVGHGNWNYRWFNIYSDKDIYLNNCQSILTTIN